MMQVKLKRMDFIYLHPFTQTGGLQSICESGTKNQIRSPQVAWSWMKTSVLVGMMLIVEAEAESCQQLHMFQRTAWVFHIRESF